MEPTDLELDQPRESDYQYEQLFGSTNIKHGIEMLPPTIQNQGAKPKTRMACGSYGICHGVNAMNRAVAEIDQMRYYDIPAEGLWMNRLEKDPSCEAQGSTLQSWLDTMKELGYITGYARVVGIDAMKDALNSYRALYTGSKKCNWRTVTSDHKYTLGDGYAHIFTIIGYNASGWIAVNSYGPANGIFYIDYEYTDSLFSVYSLHDSRDAEVFAKLK